MEKLSLFIMIFQACIYIFVYGLVLRVFLGAFRRKSNHNYFKKNVVVNSNVISSKTKTIYKDVTKEKLEMFHIDDLEVLKKYLFEIFLDFEKAYNNLDYNMMKIISTKQLYQNYYTGISLNLKVGKKRIIENIEPKKIIVYELDSTIIKQTVSAMIEISYVNYMINKNGYVISGNREKAITERFEVVFRKDFEKEDIIKCPACGASVVGNKCEFCRTTVKNVDFKISSIKRIIEEK